jgi:DNA mismatch repair protein MSH5
MIDLQQISLALKLATHRSLLIIDEFGKGTDLNGQHLGLLPWILSALAHYLIDGAGLACGIFQYLLSLGDERPKVLAATHFHEIFENGFLKPQPYLAFGHMEIRVDEDTHEDGEQIIYLYKSVPATPVKRI